MQERQSLMSSIEVTDIRQTPAFKKTVKRLKPNQKKVTLTLIAVSSHENF